MPTEKQLLAHETITRRHIRDVRKNIRLLIKELHERAKLHDMTKLESPEKEIFAENNENLGNVVYGSKEYEEQLEKIKPAVENHWAKNRHHPQHWVNGINDMDLVDILEMLSDWVASTKRNKNGNIHKSIEVNSKKYNISEQLSHILTNTTERYF